MITIGNPENLNDSLRIRVENHLHESSLKFDQSSYLEKIVKKESRILDIGKSSRQLSTLLQKTSQVYETLDLNSFGDYPDIRADICNIQLSQDLNRRYDIIVCNSILEHCYDPITACKNLGNLLSDQGIIIGSVPFLFPRHCPNDLQYQDYFRFTPDSIAILFSEFDYTYTFSHRGRLTTALLVSSLSYKYFFEARFRTLSRHLNKLLKNGRHSRQTASFDFLISRYELRNFND
jgi:SAM-dependent methyltransferase